MNSEEMLPYSHYRDLIIKYIKKRHGDVIEEFINEYEDADKFINELMYEGDSIMDKLIKRYKEAIEKLKEEILKIYTEL